MFIYAIRFIFHLISLFFWYDTTDSGKVKYVQTLNISDPSLVWQEAVGGGVDSYGHSYKNINYTTTFANGCQATIIYYHFPQWHFIEYPYLNASRNLTADSFKFSLWISVRSLSFNFPGFFSFLADSYFVNYKFVGVETSEYKQPLSNETQHCGGSLLLRGHLCRQRLFLHGDCQHRQQQRHSNLQHHLRSSCRRKSQRSQLVRGIQRHPIRTARDLWVSGVLLFPKFQRILVLRSWYFLSLFLCVVGGVCVVLFECGIRVQARLAFSPLPRYSLSLPPGLYNLSHSYQHPKRSPCSTLCTFILTNTTLLCHRFICIGTQPRKSWSEQWGWWYEQHYNHRCGSVGASLCCNCSGGYRHRSYCGIPRCQTAPPRLPQTT